jgi:hypothetical protein
MNITGLESVWELDNVNDAEAAANHMTNNNTATFITGKVGNCLHCVAASSQSLSHADNPSLSIGNIDASITLWVKLTDIPAGALYMLASKFGTTVNQEFALVYLGSSNGERFRFSIYDGLATVTHHVLADNLGVPSAGVWYFLSCVIDKTNGFIHISANAGTRNSTAKTLTMLDTTAAFDIGGNTTLSWFNNGDIDQVTLWKRALTTTDEIDLYNGGAGLSRAAMVGGAPASDIETRRAWRMTQLLAQ